ncbi:ABC transporter ATP-binding protein [Microbacterium sp. ZW T5_45]|uniref:ABC transporter ATP-binding protein n=1 Tax=Microbacterium sp. ZW T5_45 TaxID=3378080 RepID=UPI00385325EA
MTIALTAFVLKDFPVWLMPVITASIIDIVAQGGRPSAVVPLTVTAAVLLLSNYPTSMTFVRNSSRVFRDLAARLRTSLVARLQKLSIGFHNRTSASVIQSKLVRDVENIELMLSAAVPSLLSGVGLLSGALIITAIQVPVFVVVFLCTLPISVVIVLSVRRVSRRSNQGFRVDVEELSRAVGEMAHLVSLTRAHALEAESERSVAVHAERVRDSGLALDRVNGRFAVTSWVSYQLLGLGCLAGAALLSLTDVLPITPGQVVLLSSYFALLTNAVVQLLGLFPILAKGIESARSLGDVFDEEDLEHNDGKDVVDEVRGSFAFEDVTFRYPDAGAPAVRGVDIEVAAGETIAFVGASGSGKSSMLSLLMGFVTPTGGRLLLDGVDLSTIDLRSYRRFVAVVPQQPALLTGSIRENVAYGLPDVDDVRIAQALADANASEFVAELDAGWETPIGQGGAALSGGQRQRLAIARALVRDPRVLLLDEATSALDGASEALVSEALQRLMRGRTTFVVAHRLSTVRTADRIVVMNRGRIVEIGSHDDLMASGGVYARMHFGSDRPPE